MERNRRTDRDFFEEKEAEYEETYLAESENEEMGSGKLKKILIFIVILIILSSLAFYIYYINKNKTDEPNKSESKKIENFTKERKLQEKYYGFNVYGKIKIKKINLDSFFVEENVNAMDSSICILAKDGEVGKSGNLVLMGHNKKDMFKDLDKLNKNDEIEILDIYEKSTKYIVKDKYEIKPDNMESFVSDNSKNELTLVTCTSKEDKRLIIKAEAKK